MSHYLYEHYNAENCLLYIGITDDLESRLAQHKIQSSWANDIDRIDAYEFDSRALAVIAEIDSIRNRKPKHNIYHVNTGDKERIPCAYKLTIKRNIRKAILVSGKSVGQVADDCGVSSNAISHWTSERRDMLPKMANVESLCESVGITPNDLFDKYKTEGEE